MATIHVFRKGVEVGGLMSYGPTSRTCSGALPTSSTRFCAGRSLPTVSGTWTVRRSRAARTRQAVIIWLALETVEAIHEQQLIEHGGLAGIREPGQLKAILDRPRNRLLYEQPDLAALAGCYAYGLATTQTFLEGNKRTTLR
jgi:hypothetical protein